MAKYAIGVDFGTESGRALLVDVADGREVATAVHQYANGVIDEKLPGTGVRLEPDWALQDPNDYLEVFKHAVPAVLKESGVDPADVIGLGIDFTACTMLPTKADGTPLCFLPRMARAARTPGSSCGSITPRSRGQQAQRDRARELGDDVPGPLRRQDQLRMVLPQGLADPRRGAGGLRRRRPADRGRRLGHLAAHRRGDAQPRAPPATRPSGRSARASRPTTSSRRSTRGWSTWSTRRCRARSADWAPRPAG